MPHEDEIDSDQRRLRAITEEIKVICDRHNVGGVVMLASEQSAAWLHVTPKWAAIVEGKRGWILQIRGSTSEGKARTTSTLHLIASMRDMASDCVNLFGRLFRLAREQIALSGGELEHTPFGGSKHRLDPFGGKGD